MGIVAKIRELDSSLAGRLKTIVGDRLADVFDFANALYEATWDDVRPDPSGGASQVIAPHDHGHEGGSPLARACGFCEDRGSDPLYKLDSTWITEAEQRFALDHGPGLHSRAGVLGHWYGSPLFFEHAKVDVWICYSAQNSGFLFEIQETSGLDSIHPNRSLSVELAETGESQAWINVGKLHFVEGAWNQFGAYVTNKSYNASATPVFRLYAIHLCEHPAFTRPSQGHILLETSNTEYGVAFEALETDLVAGNEWMDADVLARLMWFLRGLYEGIMDRPVGPTQTVKGHDHSSTGGGVAVCRNTVAIAGNGENDLYEIQTPTANVWTICDRDSGAIRSSNSLPTIEGYVSPKIDNAGTSTQPFMDGWVHVGWAVSATVDVRLWNRNQGAYSAASSLNNNSGGWFYITEIPCDGDSWNEWDVELRADTTTITLKTNCIILSESYTNEDNTAYVAKDLRGVNEAVIGKGVG